MSRIAIRGRAAVFHEDRQVTSATTLQSLDGLVYDEERFTDYIGGWPPEEDAVAALLVPGGAIRFTYDANAVLLTATTEYTSLSPLTESQLQVLVAYTMGQWADGIGENWTTISAERCGFTIMCLTPGDDVGADYPSVEVLPE